MKSSNLIKIPKSMDANIWVQLPEVTEEDHALLQVIRGRFTGDPAFEYAYGKE
jgi:hypothetical protein